MHAYRSSASGSGQGRKRQTLEFLLPPGSPATCDARPLCLRLFNGPQGDREIVSWPLAGNRTEVRQKERFQNSQVYFLLFRKNQNFGNVNPCHTHLPNLYLRREVWVNNEYACAETVINGNYRSLWFSRQETNSDRENGKCFTKQVDEHVHKYRWKIKQLSTEQK